MCPARLKLLPYCTEPFTAQWSLYVPHSGHYTYRQFNIQQFYVLPTQCIYVFCVDLRTNSINWLVCITETKCLLRRTDWLFNADPICLSPPLLVAASATKPTQCYDMRTQCSANWDWQFEKRACGNHEWPWDLQLSDSTLFSAYLHKAQRKSFKVTMPVHPVHHVRLYIRLSLHNSRLNHNYVTRAVPNGVNFNFMKLAIKWRMLKSVWRERQNGR